MLNLFFDTERTARQLRGWRGPVMMISAVGIALFGLGIAYIQQLVLSFSAVKLEVPSQLSWLTYALMMLGTIALLYGFWVYYKDVMYQAWRYESDERPRW